MLLLLDCSVVFALALAFASVVIFVGVFVLRLVFLLHEPSGCAQLVFYQKQHVQDFWLLLALFVEHWK